jgi:dimethylhistidine N-methyltransferase
MARKQATPALNADVVGDAMMGLLQARKTLPPKLFYDETGCRLFEAITTLPEYYVTRTELAILRGIGGSLRDALPPRACLVEYGASSSLKADLVLRHLDQPRAYVPIDIAPDALLIVQSEIVAAYPGLAVTPICADFLRPVELPESTRGMSRIGFFPGSTIGNLEPEAASRFLRMTRDSLGQEALFLIGVDLRKDATRLLAAYDDAQGITAAFNLNLLTRLNREASADFDLNCFAHRAIWNDSESRIEMHLVSLADQNIRIGGQHVSFAAGETIHTENSYKHAPEAFDRIAGLAGWRVVRRWTDPDELFALNLLVARP